MKNFILIIGLLIGIIANKEHIIKISKAVSFSKSITQIGDSLRNVIVNLPISDHEIWFSNLKPSERSSIWESKLNQALMHSWSPEQVDVIQELGNWISPELFLKNSPTSLAFENNITDIQDKVLKHFSVLEATLLFFQPHNYPNNQEFVYGPSIGDGGGTRTLNCNCKWDISCSLIAQGFCENEKCTTTRYGCGFLWSFDCSERCAK